MTWKTLGESLEAALASMLNDAGEGGGETLPDAVKLRKGAGTEAPASACQGDTTLPVQEVHTSRRMAVTTPNGLPHPVAAIRLVVDNGPHFRPPRRHAPGLRVASSR